MMNILQSAKLLWVKLCDGVPELNIIWNVHHRYEVRFDKIGDIFC